jgi:ABC-type dipeptide/oligopeptide/nickel transport system permease component
MSIAILRLLAMRLMVAVPIVFLAAAVIFVALRLLPVDPAAMSMPPAATHAEIEAKRHEMGLDRSIPIQFGFWLGAVSRGDFGTSIQLRRGVLSLVAEALPQTIELALLAMALAAVMGVGGGIFMFAARRMPLAQGALDLSSTVLLSIPDFLWGLAFILIFGVYFDVLPFTGRLSAAFAKPDVTGFLLLDALIVGRPDMFADAIVHMILPVAALGFAFAPTIVRVLASSMLDVYQEDFVRQSQLRGLSQRRIIVRHVLPNAFLPTLSLMGVQFGFLFGGTLLIEVIYSYPGIGNLMVNAVRNADLPVIQAVGIVYSLGVIAITIVVDSVALVLNPKVGRR